MNAEALGRWLLFSVYRGTLTFMTFTPVSGDSLLGHLHEGSPGDQHLAEESSAGPLARLFKYHYSGNRTLKMNPGRVPSTDIHPAKQTTIVFVRLSAWFPLKAVL